MSPHRKPPKAVRSRPLAGLEQLESRDAPAIITIPDYYTASRGEIRSIPANRGVLANDFSTTNFGATLRAEIIGSPIYFDFDPDGDLAGNPLAIPVPPNTVTLNPDGSIRLAIPQNVPTNVLGIGFSYSVTNLLDPTEADPIGLPATGFAIIYIGRPSAPRIAVGADAGGPPIVNVYDRATGALVQTIEAYDPSFTGGVRVAVGDFNADGVPDVATAPGEGGSPHIKIFDGRTGRLLFNSFVFESTFRGGAHVAAGDVNRDGFVDLIVGAGTGGGPRVVALNGQGFLPLFPGIDNVFEPGPGTGPNPITNEINGFDPLMDFFAYEPTFRGGVRVAAGDLTGENYARIVTAAGVGGGPIVKTFDYFTVVGPPSILPDGKQIRLPINSYALNANGSAEASLSFYADDDRHRIGVNVGTADIDGDGKDEIITGPANGPAVVKVFGGLSGGLISQFGIPYEPVPFVESVATTGLFGQVRGPSGSLIGVAPPDSLLPNQGGSLGLAGIPGNQPPLAGGGATVTGGDIDGDGRQEVIVGSGRGNAPRVRVFRPDGTQVADFLAFPATLLTGVNVG